MKQTFNNNYSLKYKVTAMESFTLLSWKQTAPWKINGQINFKDIFPEPFDPIFSNKAQSNTC